VLELAEHSLRGVLRDDARSAPRERRVQTTRIFPELGDDAVTRLELGGGRTAVRHEVLQVVHDVLETLQLTSLQRGETHAVLLVHHPGRAGRGAEARGPREFEGVGRQTSWACRPERETLAWSAERGETHRNSFSTCFASRMRAVHTAPRSSAMSASLRARRAVRFSRAAG
jgi:hypothetical protein